MKRLVLFLVLFASMLSIKAEEMYVEISPNGSTLTFYYDDLKSSREGTVFGINEWRDLRIQNFEGGNSSLADGITSAVFDVSFKDARPTNTSYWFYDLNDLRSIRNLGYLNTSEVTDMSYMFRDCSSLMSLNLDNFDTGKVRNMRYMFSGCASLESLDVSGFDTHNVTDMNAMFAGCSSIMGGIYVSGFDTSNVTDMAYMFQGCSYVMEIGVSGLDTHNVTNMAGMFCDCTYLESLDVSNFDTRNVKSMELMFALNYCLKTLDVSNFDTRNVTDMGSMFAYTGLKSLDLSNFDTSNVTLMGNMFECCYGLESLDISNFNLSKVRSLSHMCTDVASAEHPCLLKVPENFDFREEIDFSGDYFMWQGGYFCLPVPDSQDPEIYVVISTDGSTITFYYDDLKSSREGTVYGIDEWCDLRLNFSMKEDITSAVFDASFKDARPTNTSCWFSHIRNLTTIKNLEYLNTSEVTDMSYMFEECTGLTSFDLDNFDTHNVKNMTGMFSACANIRYLDVSGFDTHNVTNMSSMFKECYGLLSLDLDNFDTGKVTNMSNMFLLCYSLRSIDLNSFNTSSVTDMSCMFGHCEKLESLDLSHFDTGKVTDMSYMFNYCSSLINLDLSHFDTGKVTDMSYMFHECSSLTNLDLDSFDTGNVTSMLRMFCDCSSLISLDLSHFDTGKVTDMGEMFYMCRSLTSLDIYNFNISNVQEISGMCSAVAFEDNPCLLYVPDGFDFREEIDFSGDYFEWQGGYFRLPETDKLKVEPITVYKGNPSTMAIELKNPSSEKYIGYQFKIVLPEGVSICKKDNGQYSYTQGNRYGNTQMMMNIREQNDGSYMVLCFSLSNTPISGHEGAILSLDITSDGSLDDGSYEGAIRGIKFSTTEDADALLPDATFKVNVSKYELGDVNNDGSVSITDITMAVNYILGKASDKFHASHGDMNHDGEINISDLSEMVEIILNSGNNAPVNIGVTGGLRMESAGSECSLYLPDAGLYKGCQFLVRVPSGCRLSDVSVGAGRESGHRVMYRQTGTGLYKVLVFSADGNEFEDVPSALLRLTVDGQNGGAVELSDIRFTDTDFTEHGFAAVSSEVTGIGAVAKGASESTWYSLDGQKTAQPTKGVFVRDGRKVVVK